MSEMDELIQKAVASLEELREKCLVKAGQIDSAIAMLKGDSVYSVMVVRSDWMEQIIDYGKWIEDIYGKIVGELVDRDKFGVLGWDKGIVDDYKQAVAEEQGVVAETESNGFEVKGEIEVVDDVVEVRDATDFLVPIRERRAPVQTEVPLDECCLYALESNGSWMTLDEILAFLRVCDVGYQVTGGSDVTVKNKLSIAMYRKKLVFQSVGSRRTLKYGLVGWAVPGSDVEQKEVAVAGVYSDYMWYALEKLGQESSMDAILTVLRESGGTYKIDENNLGVWVRRFKDCVKESNGLYRSTGNAGFLYGLTKWDKAQ